MSYLGWQRLRVRANALDLQIYRSIRGLAHDGTTVEWVKRYSALGEHGIGWLGLGACGATLDDRRRGRWIKATATVGVAYVTSSSVKVMIGRQRPVVENLPQLMRTPTGLSFPSSHSASSFAAAQAFGRLLPQPLLYTAAAGMAFSRMYLGVHYPSDIAAGAALGTFMGRFGR